MNCFYLFDCFFIFAWISTHVLVVIIYSFIINDLVSAMNIAPDAEHAVKN